MTRKSKELPLGVIVISKNQREAYLLLRYLKDNRILVHVYQWGAFEPGKGSELQRSLRVMDYGLFFDSRNFVVNLDSRNKTHLAPFHEVMYNNSLIGGVLRDIVRPQVKFLDTNYRDVTIKSVDWKSNKIVIVCGQKDWKYFIGERTFLTLALDKAIKTVPLLITKKMCDDIISRFIE